MTGIWGRAIAPWSRKRRKQDPKPIQFHYRRLIHRLRVARHWWLKPHTPYRPVFILATQRSGSSLIGDYIGNMPGVESQGEILCPALAKGPSGRLETDQALRYVRYSLQMLSAPIRVCKLMLDHLAMHHLTVDDLDCGFPDSRFIVIYRQSLAEQFVSRQAAVATKQWFLTAGREQKQVLVNVDPVALQTYCDQTRQAYREVLQRPWLAKRGALVSYEDLAAQPAVVMREQICPLLGVKYAEPRTIFVKQNQLPLADRVANYKQVAGLLASPLCQQHWTWRSAEQGRLAAG